MYICLYLFLWNIIIIEKKKKTYKDSFTTMKISQLQSFPVRLRMIAMQSIDHLGKNRLKIEDILKID